MSATLFTMRNKDEGSIVKELSVDHLGNQGPQSTGLSNTERESFYSAAQSTTGTSGFIVHRDSMSKKVSLQVPGSSPNSPLPLPDDGTPEFNPKTVHNPDFTRTIRPQGTHKDIFKKVAATRAPWSLKREWSWTHSHVVKVVLSMFIIFVYWLLLSFIYMSLERENTDSDIKLRSQLREDLKSQLGVKYGINENAFDAIESDFFDIFDLPDSNPWEDLETVFIFTATISTTLGFGVFSPSTDGGKLLTVFGGLIGIILVTICLIQIYQMEHTFFKILIRILARLGVFIPESDILWDAIHTFLITFYIFCCSAIVACFDKTDGLNGWTHIDMTYAYFQLWTTVGFGDMPVYYNTYGHHISWMAFPFFLVGFAMWPAWVLRVYNMLIHPVQWLLSRCELCENCVPERMRTAVDISRKSVYSSYNRYIDPAVVISNRQPGMSTINMYNNMSREDTYDWSENQEYDEEPNESYIYDNLPIIEIQSSNLSINESADNRTPMPDVLAEKRDKRFHSPKRLRFVDEVTDEEESFVNTVSFADDVIHIPMTSLSQYSHSLLPMLSSVLECSEESHESEARQPQSPAAIISSRFLKQNPMNRSVSFAPETELQTVIKLRNRLPTGPRSEGNFNPEIRENLNEDTQSLEVDFETPCYDMAELRE